MAQVLPRLLEDLDQTLEEVDFPVEEVVEEEQVLVLLLLGDRIKYCLITTLYLCIITFFT